MNYVGSSRVVTLSYQEHQTAEDYAGVLSSPLSLRGSYKVIEVVQKYKNYEDTIDYNTFISNQNSWKKGNGYQCLTLAGKSILVPKEELGGNSILLEGVYQNETYQIGLYHLGEIYVQKGEIIQDEKILGTQGNTGVVLSNKPLTDKDYGTHVHVEVKNSKNEFLNPRPFVSGAITLSYQEDISSKEPSYTLLFKCPRNDTYFVKLQKGEELYLKKKDNSL